MPNHPSSRGLGGNEFSQSQRRAESTPNSDRSILLLILRCLVLLLLAWRSPGQRSAARRKPARVGHQDVTGVIILDNSYSMSGTDGVRSRFEQAKLAAAQALDTMPSGSSVALILASRHRQPRHP